MKFTKNPKYSYPDLSNAIRILTCDSIEHAGSGHPGMPLGMADVMTYLVFNFLKFCPQDPKWFNRDRFVLSNGHGSMLLYSFYYLTGYIDFSIDELKNFRRLGSKAAGHPEHEIYQAIETTTGPLGQGFAAAVGMAIAQKKYQYRLVDKVCNYKVYCVVGDGCLMEGISYEAASLAGHLKLNNMIVLFDDNNISIDGNTDLTISEDHLKKFTALGWNVESINGHDFQNIHKALENAQNSDKPYFIACRTQIGRGAPNKVGIAEAHGSPLGKDEVKLIKKNLQVKDIDFHIEDELLDIWRDAWQFNNSSYTAWQVEYSNMSVKDREYLDIESVNISNVLENITLITKQESTRASSGKVIAELNKNFDKIICGSADLSLSNCIKNQYSVPISKDDFSGNFIHYGVRENAMAAIMNGLSLSGFLPIGGSFFVFSDYMRPSIRLSAIMQRQVIYVLTHDSIAIGEDGPTHQPIEHLASFRAMPNILVLRPADFIETIECWNIALSHVNTPSLLVLTRQAVKQVRTSHNRNLAKLGAYDLGEDESSDIINDVTLFASGSELSIAVDVAKILKQSNLKTRIISVPCFELFFQQSAEYISSILQNTKLKVAIEAGSEFGWHRIIGDGGIFFGINEFGKSASCEVLYKHFGLTALNISQKIIARIDE